MVSIVCKRYGILLHKYCGEKDFVWLCYVSSIIYILAFTWPIASSVKYLSISRSWYHASLMYSLKYNQQDATLYSILYRCQCCTCFRRFSRPSSGAQTVYTASGICQACLLLLLVWVSANSPTLAVAASKLDIHQLLCVQFELLMVGGKTAWNTYSIDSDKEYCITLHLVGYT